MAASGYRTVLLVTVIAVGSVFGMFFMVPLMLSDLNGLDVMKIGVTLFAPATAAALAGPLGGRLIDARGSGRVVTMGILFILAGYLLLSTFAGEEPVLVALLLVIPYIGFSFIQSSLPHRAAASIPPGFSGVGMGTYNLIFFLSGAFSAAVIGRILDRPPMEICLNPLATCAGGRAYSNIFLGLAFTAAAALVLYRRSFIKESEE
jgi:DHA2 family metal-tetracycline-proton antiporter-like MFS transporter